MDQNDLLNRKFLRGFTFAQRLIQRKNQGTKKAKPGSLFIYLLVLLRASNGHDI